MQLTVKSVNPYNNSFEMLVKDLLRWKKSGYRMLLLSPSRTRAARLAKDLQDQELSAFYSEDPEELIQPGQIKVTWGRVSRGFEYPMVKYVRSRDGYFRQRKRKNGKKSQYSGKQIQSFSELSIRRLCGS